jgi:hypothetical protein
MQRTACGGAGAPPHAEPGAGASVPAGRPPAWQQAQCAAQRPSQGRGASREGASGLAGTAGRAAGLQIQGGATPCSGPPGQEGGGQRRDASSQVRAAHHLKGGQHVVPVGGVGLVLGELDAAVHGGPLLPVVADQVQVVGPARGGGGWLRRGGEFTGWAAGYEAGRWAGPAAARRRSGAPCCRRSASRGRSLGVGPAGGADDLVRLQLEAPGVGALQAGDRLRRQGRGWGRGPQLAVATVRRARSIKDPQCAWGWRAWGAASQAGGRAGGSPPGRCSRRWRAGTWRW